ncbi:hypothetical protein ABW19_dt0204046 [Dactylella cylindrospora]|nr:hypothetical protein ABW19_dt0204046 [Dactylella cylindrospora]
MSPTQGSFSAYGVQRKDSKHSLQQHLGGFTGMPDLNALMFPASNAYAYGSQAMIFDASPFGESVGDSAYSQDGRMSAGSGRQSFGTGSPSFDNVEVQLYGPLPPYVYSMEDPNQGFGTPGGSYPSVGIPPTVVSAVSHDSTGLANFPHTDSDREHARAASGYHMSLDDFLRIGMNDEEWEPMFANQRQN